MAERGKSVRAVGLSDKAYFLVCRWKAAWSERLGAPLSWAEFLEGMANDKGTWPKQRAP